MNKISYSTLFFLLFVNFYSFAAASSSNQNPMEPVIDAKISQSAIDKAASLDGVKGVVGLLFSSYKYEASIGRNLTSKKISVAAFTAGMEYAKSFKNNLFLAIQLLGDIAPKKKKESDWNSLNADMNTQILVAGTRTAKLETGLLTPSIGIKAGYWFRKRKCVAFLKFSCARITGKYSYYINGNQFAKIDTNAIAPSILLGGEYKINKKIGAGFEIGFPLKKRFHKKYINSDTEHKTRMSRVELRLLGTYTISKTDSMPDSFSDNFGK